ncbi:hypothetical protein QFZ99_006048 [Paraburkholderia atlantica]|uniref:hypothetical protein n=1 Tax=Paraburkholderia atlantica TaxID=2654982 RepID=UPI003D1ADE0B
MNSEASLLPVRVIVCDDDDCRMRLREVRGLDADAVYARALDVKNILPADRGPYIESTRRDIETGEWVIAVAVRVPLE